MNNSDFKKSLFIQFSKVAKALAHENRLELIEFLAQGESSVENLANATQLSIANTSQHLQRLNAAGLVKTRKEGRFVLYQLADDNVVQLLIFLRQVACKNLAEADRLIENYLGDLDALEPVPQKELSKRLKKREVTVIDVRPANEYDQGHITGAINMPADEIAGRLSEISKNKSIVAYCRGPFCLMSFDAIEILRSAGYDARRLEDGFPEWKSRRLPHQHRKDNDRTAKHN